MTHEVNALKRVCSLGMRKPVQPSSCPNPAMMKKLINIGRILKAGFILLKDITSPLKSGLAREPRSMVGTRNSVAKIQYPIPTRQINNRLNISFNPALPSTNAVMIIPAIEADRTEANASSGGSSFNTTKDIVPAPSTNANTQNEIIGYLCTILS